MHTDPFSCVLIADDLTGACDSALQFKLHGAKSVVYLSPDRYHPGKAHVHAFNADTRDMQLARMHHQIQRIAAITSSAAPAVIFKKIDSLLRGNPGAEISAAMRAFACDLAIITPAFPAMGRVVRNGHLEVLGDSAWKPIHVLSLLRAQGVAECLHVSPDNLSASLKRGATHISLDAVTQSDLIQILTSATNTGRKILWAGSAGLALALAKAFCSKAVIPEVPHPGTSPPAFFIGSTHPVTQLQVEALRSQRPTVEVSLDIVTLSSLTSALSHGAHAIVRVPERGVHLHQLRSLLQAIQNQVRAIIMSGGDTASLVCRSIDAHEIEIAGQVVTGLPWGRLRGGLLDGFLAATKSGAFGVESDLITVADFFTCKS